MGGPIFRQEPARCGRAPGDYVGRGPDRYLDALPSGVRGGDQLVK
ncbi:MAG TPA: hypothetical protein VKT82_16215 [Ktedonobacterales bacterium]|nr:hypothetical protein [Ktedonobacterales bacterium]